MHYGHAKSQIYIVIGSHDREKGRTRPETTQGSTVHRQQHRTCTDKTLHHRYAHGEARLAELCMHLAKLHGDMALTNGIYNPRWNLNLAHAPNSLLSTWQGKQKKNEAGPRQIMRFKIDQRISCWNIVQCHAITCSTLLRPVAATSVLGMCLTLSCFPLRFPQLKLYTCCARVAQHPPLSIGPLKMRHLCQNFSGSCQIWQQSSEPIRAVALCESTLAELSSGN